MKRGIIILLLALALLPASSFHSQGASDNIGEEKSINVPLGIVKTAAMHFAEENYGKMSIYHIEPYYDIEGNITVYCIIFKYFHMQDLSLEEVLNNINKRYIEIKNLNEAIESLRKQPLSGKKKYEEIGGINERIKILKRELNFEDTFVTILAGATKKHVPIIMMHKGLPRHLTEFPKAIEKIGQTPGIQGSKLGDVFYLGMFDIYYQITSNEKEFISLKSFHIETLTDIKQKIEESESAAKTVGYEERKALKDEILRKKWEAVELLHSQKEGSSKKLETKAEKRNEPGSPSESVQYKQLNNNKKEVNEQKKIEKYEKSSSNLSQITSGTGKASEKQEIDKEKYQTNLDGLTNSPDELETGMKPLSYIQSTTTGVLELSSGTQNYSISDLGYGWVQLWNSSGAPAGARVTSVEYRLRIDDTGDPNSFYCGDYEIYLSSEVHGSPNKYLLVYNNLGGRTDYGYDDDIEDDSDIYINWRSTTAFNGENPNQKWCVWVEDTYSGDSGILSYIEFRIHWEADNPEPNLTPYKPSGWDDKIVVSGSSGTNTNSSVYQNQIAYIDVAWENNGNADAGYHKCRLYLDGVQILWAEAPDLFQGYYRYGTDWQYTFTMSGWHTLRFVVDSDSNVAESNEGDNVYERQVYINPVYPNLKPYQPSGWDDKIVVSNQTGTYTNGDVYQGQTSYIDFAWENNGNIDAGYHISRLYVDGIQIFWTEVSYLFQGYYQYGTDWQYTFTESGWHTLKMVVDSDSNVIESNEGDNIYERQVYVNPPIIISQNKISGVPGYNQTSDDCAPVAASKVLAYWDDHAYNDIVYWNLVDHGNSNTGDVSPIEGALTHTGLVEDLRNASNWVNGVGTYVNELASGIETVCNNGNYNNNLNFSVNLDYTISYSALQFEIDSGRPLVYVVIGHPFYGNHAVTAIGYRETSATKWVIAKVNWYGDIESEIDWDEATYAIIGITPGGTPNDEYEDLNGQDDDSKANAKWLDPQDVYEFRQTHNFKAGISGIGNDTQDWIKFNAIAGRQYTIETRNLGANCDTKLMIDWDGATYCLYDDDGGDEPLASKIVWDCAANTTVYILVTEYYERVGHNTNYDLEVAYTNIVIPQTPTPISPYDNEYIYTLYPMFEWSAFQNGGNGATQTGFQFRVRCDTDGDIIVYDTGFVSTTSGRTHTYNPGAYSGIDPVTGDTRVSQSLQWGKHYHWHVRYLDSNNKWSAWSANTINSHQDFYTQIPTYTLSISIYPSNTGSVTKNPDKTSYNQNEVVQLTPIPATGYTFVGWTGDVISTANPLSVTMNSNKNITANFTPITYTLNVSVNPSGSGSVTKNPNKSSYNYNEVVQLTAAPAAGYTFSSWSGDASGTANPLSVTMNSNKNITANFTPITYTLNVSVNPSGSGSVTKNPNKSSYNYNEVVQLTAAPAAGYTFSSWSGDASGTANPLSVTMNSNKNITANFTSITYTLNVSVNPSGSGSVTKNPEKSSYNYNEVVQLTATPAAGYTFSSWSGDASGTNNPLSINMNANKTITANFSEKPNIKITSPNNGENWEVNSLQPITWTSLGITANVIIDYSINGGKSWLNITGSTENDGIYYWRVPDKPSNKCLIRIRVNNKDISEIDLSDATFSIIAPSLPAIVVKFPNGREQLSVGSTYMIKWINVGTVGDVKIEYSINNGTSWLQIANNASNVGNYAWEVPDTISNNCLIRINEIDGVPSDESDAIFSIIAPVITLTSPNGGENLIIGSTHEITWTTTKPNWQTRLEYSTDNGTSWEIIIPCTPNNGSYLWTVPNTPSDFCLIKIRKYDNDYEPMDISNAVFFIKQNQSLKLNAPNGNEIIEPGKNFLIKWESNPEIENIKLEYSPDNGSTYFLITDQVPNTGCYEWLVPYHISNDCLVRISKAGGFKPSSLNLVYEFKLKIQPPRKVIGNEVFTMWLGDLLKLKESMTNFTPQISIIRESNGDNYIRLDESMKEIQPLSEEWCNLKVSLNIETQLASIWIDDKIIFENLPLKLGMDFIPAVSFLVSLENSMIVELDDFSLQLLTLTNKEEIINTLFTEDFENFNAARFPKNSGWEKSFIEIKNTYGTGYSEQLEQSVIVYRDKATGMKSLKIQAFEDNQVIVVKRFNIPESFPFDISDKKFSIFSNEGMAIE